MGSRRGLASTQMERVTSGWKPRSFGSVSMGASVPLVRITCLKMSVMGFMPSEAAQQTRRRRACEAVPVWEGE